MRLRQKLKNEEGFTFTFTAMFPSRVDENKERKENGTSNGAKIFCAKAAVRRITLIEHVSR